MNVIVGPNAIGKTTVLQAIRLPKALAAPRVQSEAQQVLISLGAASAHFPNRIMLNALARDPTKQVEIRCKYVLTEGEIAVLIAAQVEITNVLMQSRLGQGFANPTVLIQFVNSPQGRAVYDQTAREISTALETVRRDKSIILGVTLPPNGAQIGAHDPVGATLITFLDQRLEPHVTLFSYFPADRAIPVGEVAVQLGAADTQQQLEAHNSQPQIKYNRLKHTIFNTVIRSESERQLLQTSFDEIFSGLLTGRRVLGPRVNELGLLSIIVEDIESKRQFEMDGLSSGEKGLILTFLLIAKTVTKGGIVLLDEPELHLNPAVCRDILPFVLRQYAIPHDLQFIVCSHSPQILTSAFESDEAVLHHLESPTQISKVGRRAYDELADALQKLGTSVSESLMYQGTVLVEGDDDERLLAEGFSELFQRFKISDRGGRREIEKIINKLQTLEARGEKVDPIYLIFDGDNSPTDLTSSKSVKIMQWPRYCLENYLIDLDVITGLLKLDDVAKEPGAKAGEVATLFRELAFKQLDDLATRATYRELDYKSPSFKLEDIDGKSPEEAAVFLYARSRAARDSIPDQTEIDWTRDFLERQTAQRKAIELIWEASWKERCNGKRLFRDFQATGRIKISPSAFKRRIMQQMKTTTSENWTLLSGLLSALIKG
jgi:ABC-type cobalamin/Fe3+-siderophores transport system ATPase subunit